MCATCSRCHTHRFCELAGHRHCQTQLHLCFLLQVICTKVRDGDKRIVRLKEGEPRGRHVVIVDDLVQSGGTLVECQKLLSTQVGTNCTLSGFLTCTGHISQAVSCHRTQKAGRDLVCSQVGRVHCVNSGGVAPPLATLLQHQHVLTHPRRVPLLFCKV